jgi:hypothetical protein
MGTFYIKYTPKLNRARLYNGGSTAAFPFSEKSSITLFERGVMKPMSMYFTLTDGVHTSSRKTHQDECANDPQMEGLS